MKIPLFTKNSSGKHCISVSYYGLTALGAIALYAALVCARTTPPDITKWKGVRVLFIDKDHNTGKVTATVAQPGYPNSEIRIRNDQDQEVVIPQN